MADISKVYDGSTTADAPTPTLTGVVSGDSVTAAATGSYDSKNVGSRTVNYSLTLSGTDAANYSLASAATGSGTITAKTLTATMADISKVYDGSTTADAPTPTLNGVVSGDSVTVAATGSYDSKNVGSRTVNYSLTLSGTDAANYSLADSVTGSGVITARPVTLTADAVAILRGTEIPTLSGTADNMVSGDPAPTWTTTATATSRSGQYPINGTLDNSIAANYEVTQAAGNATALTINFNSDMPDGPTPAEPEIVPTDTAGITEVLANEGTYANNPISIGQKAAAAATEETSAPPAPQVAVAADMGGERASLVNVNNESGSAASNNAVATENTAAASDNTAAANNDNGNNANNTNNTDNADNSNTSDSDEEE